MSYEFEEWKLVYGIYEVSTYGRVRSIDTYINQKLGSKALKRGRYLKINTNGRYDSVQLTINGKNKNVRLHKLIAETFIPNKWRLPEVNHRDENKHNNCVWNLEWCTRDYNINYGTRNERISSPVEQYSLDGKLIATYKSINEAAETTGINKSTISACCNNYKYRHTAGGYIWKYQYPK